MSGAEDGAVGPLASDGEEGMATKSCLTTIYTPCLLLGVVLATTSIASLALPAVIGRGALAAHTLHDEAVEGDSAQGSHSDRLRTGCF